jgi:hypothetical protein
MTASDHESPDGEPIGTFRQAEGKARSFEDFWTVWCPQEGVFVESIWFTQYQAQADANMHNRNHSAELGFHPPHSSFPYQVVYGQQ